MKTLVIGCGSIGRRHARNAHALGSDVVLCDPNERRMQDFGQALGVKEYYPDYTKAIAQSGADVAVVATPSNLHVEPARKALEAGLHILVEKPLCLSPSEGKELLALARKTNLVCMMAHTYRFRSEWNEVKKLLDEGELGKIYSAEFTGGWYLPDWHIHEDYRHEYAAQNRLGGGVVLTNLSHIFDIVMWFFGEIEKIVGAKFRQSPLDIDVDDAVICALRTSSGVAVVISEDFLSRCPRRQLRVNAEYGYVEADFNRQTLSIWDMRTKRFPPDSQLTDDDGDSRFKILEDGVAYNLDPDVIPMKYSGNDAYLSEMEYFFSKVESGKTHFDLDIEAGIRVLEAMFSAGIKDWTPTTSG